MAESAIIINTNDTSPVDGTSLEQMLAVSTEVLRQALDLLENVLTDDEQLTTASKYLPGSTIGKHLRHARDHFILLADCVEGSEPHILSYDTRIRNTPMESKIHDAMNSLKEVIGRLQDVVPRMKLDSPITLNAVTPFMQTFETTFGRELWFTALHAVHHWSMVRVIAGEMGITLADDFGFAPSTLVYKNSDAPLGKGKM